VPSFDGVLGFKANVWLQFLNIIHDTTS